MAARGVTTLRIARTQNGDRHHSLMRCPYSKWRPVASLPHVLPVSKMAALSLTLSRPPVPKMASPVSLSALPRGGGGACARPPAVHAGRPARRDAATSRPAPATGARGHGGRQGDRQRHRVPARAERRRLPPGRGQVHHEGVSEAGTLPGTGSAPAVLLLLFRGFRVSVFTAISAFYHQFLE